MNFLLFPFDVQHCFLELQVSDVKNVQNVPLTEKLTPQASQSRDHVVLTTEAGLSNSDMEPHFQNPHLDYQISVFPLPPEVRILRVYVSQIAGRICLMLIDSD